MWYEGIVKPNSLAFKLSISCGSLHYAFNLFIRSNVTFLK